MGKFKRIAKWPAVERVLSWLGWDVWRIRDLSTGYESIGLVRRSENLVDLEVWEYRSEVVDDG